MLSQNGVSLDSALVCNIFHCFKFIKSNRQFVLHLCVMESYDPHPLVNIDSPLKCYEVHHATLL